MPKSLISSPSLDLVSDLGQGRGGCRLRAEVLRAVGPRPPLRPRGRAPLRPDGRQAVKEGGAGQEAGAQGAPARNLGLLRVSAITFEGNTPSCL